MPWRSERNIELLHTAYQEILYRSAVGIQNADGYKTVAAHVGASERLLEQNTVQLVKAVEVPLTDPDAKIDTAEGQIKARHFVQFQKVCGFIQTLPSQLGRLRRWLSTKGTVVVHMPSGVMTCNLATCAKWDRDDRHGLICEYEQVMGAGRLTNANPNAKGHGEFKKLPIYRRHASAELEEDVNKAVLDGAISNEDYIELLKKYHSSIRGPCDKITDAANITDQQLDAIQEVNLNEIFHSKYRFRGSYS